MAAKIVQFGSRARRSLGDALREASRLVRPTLGPHGRAVLSQHRADQAPTFLTTGVEILKELESADRPINSALQMLRDAAQKLHSTAGDGTATFTILTEAIYASALRHVEAGRDPLELFSTLQGEARPILSDLQRRAVPIDTPDKIRRIAESAAGFDSTVAALFEGVAEKLGRGAAVIVEESTHIESIVKEIEGFQCPHGYVTSHLVNRKETSQVMMERPLVLVYEPEISDLPALAAFLERIAKLRRPVVLFTSDIQADPIATLVVNYLRGVVHVGAVRVRSEELLEDLAAFTGATLILKSSGPTLDRVTPDQLGEVERAVIDAGSTTLMRGRGNVSSVLERIKRRLATEDLPVIDREALQERAARLSGSLVQFFAGGASRFEMQHHRLLLRGAVNAVRSAIQGGAVLGAGAAWIDAARKASLLKEALTAPVGPILANSGFAPRPGIEKLLKEKPGRGFDVVSGKIVDSGIWDPHLVVRGALQTALSLAGTFLGCEAIVTEAAGTKDVFIPPNIEEAERARRALK